MGVYKLTINLLKSDLKQCIFYCLSIAFSVGIIFNAFNIVTNESFVALGKNEAEVSSTIIFSIISIVILFTFFANSYFIMSKSKEIATSILSGANYYKISALLFFQNFIIIGLGSILGYILGIIISPLFLYIMFRGLGISGSILDLSTEGIWGTFAVIMVQFFCVSYGDFMYVSSKEITELMKENRQVYKPDDRIVKTPKIVYLIIYLIPIVTIFINPKKLDPSALIFINIVLSIYGTQGVIRYFLPDTILKLKKNKYINDKVKLISFSNLHYSLRKLDFLVVILSVSTITLIALSGLYSHSSSIKIVSICSYITIIILMAITILYKLMIEVSNRRYAFKQLRLIGYTISQIKKVIFHEVKIFYYMVIGIPLFHIVIYLILFRNIGIISTTLSLAFLGVYLVTFLIIGIISYFVYRRLITSYL